MKRELFVILFIILMNFSFASAKLTHGEVSTGGGTTNNYFNGSNINLTTTTCSGTDKVSAINNATGVVTCSTVVSGSGGLQADGTYLYNDSTKIYLNTTLADTNLSVNSSRNWANLTGYNTTHFSNDAGILTIVQSWLSSFVNSLIDSRVTQAFVKALGFYNTTEVNDINISMRNYVDFQNTSQTNYILQNNNSVNNWITQNNNSVNNNINFQNTSNNNYILANNQSVNNYILFVNSTNGAGGGSATKVNNITCSGTDKISSYDNVTGNFVCTTVGAYSGSTPKAVLFSHWVVSQTKTNIGTAWTDIYVTTNSNGKASRINTTGYTEVMLHVNWNKVGTGTQSINISNNGCTLINGDVVSGENTFGWSSIPACATDIQQSFKPRVKSTTAADDPIFESADLWLR